MELVISHDGVIRYVYEELLDLSACGMVAIRRASHVEPDNTGRWSADLSPVDGPKLGPFPLRSTAVAAEIAWLTQHRLLGERA